MRKFEQSIDQTIPQDSYMVARLDGRGFTKLTKESSDLKCSFDENFGRKLHVNYELPQSDEYSKMISHFAGI